MEILLAVLLALAVVACAWLWAARKDALARERLLSHEIAGMKRASQGSTVAVSSPDLRPLFPDLPAETPAPPEPPAPEPAPDLPEPARHAPSLPAHLLVEADRHRDALRALDERLSRLEAPAREPSAPASPPHPPDRDPGTDRLAASVAGIGTAIEPFVDRSTRLRSDLAAVEAAAIRALESLEAALPLARDAARQTDALSPLVSTLTGLEDRLNLLSLDASLAAEPGGTRAPRQEASVEIRSLFDEMRTFSRDLAARVRRATEGARRSEEAFSALRETIDGVRERSAAASSRGDQLASVAPRLEEAMDSLRSVSDWARLELEKLGRVRAALEQRLSIELQAAQRKAIEAAVSAQVEETARKAVREERKAAEELAEILRAASRR